MNRQHGVALITAILVVALAGIAATAVLTSANLAIHRTQTLQDSERAWWVAEGIESWIKAVLEADADDNDVDHPGEGWAKPVDYLPVDEGAARGAIVDLQGRFNLNNLLVKNTDKYEKQFNRLLTHIQVDNAAPPQGFVGLIRDWMDADDEPGFPAGAEDTDYLILSPVPYRAANQPMVAASELLAIQGVDPKLYAALKPYVTALPVTTPINVNTAPEVVLRSLSETPDEAKLAAFIKSRAETPADDVQKLVNDATLGADLDPSLVSVSTRYFSLQAQVFIGSSRVSLYSLIFRPEQGAPVVLSHATEEL